MIVPIWHKLAVIITEHAKECIFESRAYKNQIHINFAEFLILLLR